MNSQQQPINLLKIVPMANSISQAFVLGGRAIFTVKSGKSDEYVTYRVKCPPQEIVKPIELRTYFAAVLTGQDNESSYSYMGILKPMSGEIVLTGKSKFRRDADKVQIFQWAIRQIWGDKNLPHGYAIKHAGKCGMCGRTLTTPESIDRGIGPECWKRL